MQYRYAWFEEELTDAGGVPHRSLGVAGYRQDRGGPHLVTVVADVSADRIWMEHFVNKCTRMQLHPLHLLDTILDALP
ncbi:MAG: hypothetical protein Q4C72_09155 [Eubacteriales bacterium]|nr:hypothetical protein [Eubacteriales bacterium]